MESEKEDEIKEKKEEFSSENKEEQKEAKELEKVEAQEKDTFSGRRKSEIFSSERHDIVEKKDDEQGISASEENKENKIDSESKVDDIPEKKEEDSKKDEPKKEDDKKKGDNEKKDVAGWIIVGVIILAMIIAILFLSLNSKPKIPKTEEFYYNGFLFRKVPFGNDSFVYAINITIIKNNAPFEYEFKFRNDPRMIGVIPANISSVTSKTYFSFTPETTNCTGDALISAFQLGQFLNAMGVNVMPAITQDSENNTLPVKTCADALTNTVIMLEPFSNETRIYRDPQYRGCIVLEAQGCQVTEVTERYILAVIEKYNQPDRLQGLNNSGNLSNLS